MNTKDIPIGFTTRIVIVVSMLLCGILSGCPGPTNPTPSSDKAITAFAITGSVAAIGTINEDAKTITVRVPHGTTVTGLVATFTTTGVSVKVGAAAQVSGTTANDFTSSVAYSVTAADGSTQDYAVTVTKAPNSAKAITAFSFASPVATGIIDENAKTIAVSVPYVPSVTALVATFTTTGSTVQVGSTTQVSGTTTNDFTSPVVYIVTAEDNSTANYTVTVTVALPFITFDKNGTYTKGTMSDQSIAFGSSAYLTACGFTRPGFTFSGWSTAPTGSVEYADGVSYTMTTSHVTLYAVWSWVSYSLRDTGPAGGLIFYINPNAATDGWKYLEAAPSDQASAAVWGTYNFTVSGADGTAIGTGKQNTLDIIAGDTATSDKAADACANYSILHSDVTYDDWFLPSSSELGKMYVNLKSGTDENAQTYTPVGDFSDTYYWSSSEFDATHAKDIRFDTNFGLNAFKSNTLNARAIRAF